MTYRIKQKYTKHTTIYKTMKKSQKNITTLQHFATLHHTSPNYTSLPHTYTSLPSHLVYSIYVS